MGSGHSEPIHPLSKFGKEQLLKQLTQLVEVKVGSNTQLADSGSPLSEESDRGTQTGRGDLGLLAASLVC